MSAVDDFVLSIESGKRQGDAIRLPRSLPRIVIGNRKSSHISIRDPWISWDHASLEWKDGGLVIEDLDSSNGTYVNKQRLQAPRPFAPGDQVHFAKTQATLVLASSLEGRTLKNVDNSDVAETAATAGLAAPAEKSGCMGVLLLGAGVLGWWLA